MSEYTPTTEDVRFAMAGLRMSAERFVTRDSFDRWLAAHDAEVQAQVVAEEPEWAEEWTAYGRGVMGEFMIPEPKGPNYATHQRVVKAGPWVPVKQEGAETDA